MSLSHLARTTSSDGWFRPATAYLVYVAVDEAAVLRLAFAAAVSTLAGFPAIMDFTIAAGYNSRQLHRHDVPVSSL
jgi:hypothetical protein